MFFLIVRVVMLRVELLEKSNRQVRRRRDESTESYLARLTHVTVTGQGITTIVRVKDWEGL